MDARIQLRVDEETTRLAQLMAESQGRTLSDACRELTKSLATEQRKSISHDTWLSEQVNAAFEKFDAGEANFVDHNDAKIDNTETKIKVIIFIRNFIIYP